jgi:hypothetical protein
MGVDAAQAAEATTVTTSRGKFWDEYRATVANNYPLYLAATIDEQAQLPVGLE